MQAFEHILVSPKLASRPRTKKPAARQTIKKDNGRAADPRSYRPYHAGGEVAFLLVMALAGLAVLTAPLDFFLRLPLAIVLLVVAPLIMLREYWPKLTLAQLGWQRPRRPEHRTVFALVVIVIAFLPALAFLTWPQAHTLAAVGGHGSWLTWGIAELLVAAFLLAQTIFFSGFLLFRLAHLLHPSTAIAAVAIIMTLGQGFLPGALKLIVLPAMLALVWIAWEAQSFVPVAVIQILLTVAVDLIVRLS